MSTAFIKTVELHEYLDYVVVKPTLSSVIKLTCQLYTNNDGMFFYDKEDVRQCVVKYLFNELETHVTTYLVENNDIIKPYTVKPNLIK